MTIAPVPPDDAPPGRFRDLMADTLHFAGRRLYGVGLIAAAAAVAEGAGLILLLPVLHAIGITGSERMSQPLVDALGPLASLEGALVIYAAVVTLAACTLAARGILVFRLKRDSIDSLRTRLHARILRADWRAVARYRQSDLGHILSVEINRTGEGVEFLLRLIGWSLEIPVLAAVALSLSPTITGLTLVFSGLIVFAARPIDKLTHQVGRRLGPSGRRILNTIGENLTSLTTIKIHAAEASRIAHLQHRIGELRAEQFRLERANALARIIALSGAAVAIAAIVWLALGPLGLAVADTLVLVVALARLLPVATRVQDGWRQMLRALPAHATAVALLDEMTAAAEPEVPVPTDAADQTPPAITLEAVSYHYHRETGPVLRDVTATIPAGAHVSIVGASGAGKSTLALILTGLLIPRGGRLTIAGKPLDDAARIAWRRRTSLVAQDPVLFNDTIANNLRLAKPSASDADLRACLKAAEATFVTTLADGLETIVGERGLALSGGERQRIALARALLAGPAILVLDEPTAALDPAGEARIIETLNLLRGKTTLVTISHRPSLARAADTVIVLENGVCIGHGPWAALHEETKRRVELLGL